MDTALAINIAWQLRLLGGITYLGVVFVCCFGGERIIFFLSNIVNVIFKGYRTMSH